MKKIEDFYFKHKTKIQDANNYTSVMGIFCTEIKFKFSNISGVFDLLKYFNLSFDDINKETLENDNIITIHITHEKALEFLDLLFRLGQIVYNKQYAVHIWDMFDFEDDDIDNEEYLNFILSYYQSELKTLKSIYNKIK